MDLKAQVNRLQGAEREVLDAIIKVIETKDSATLDQSLGTYKGTKAQIRDFFLQNPVELLPDDSSDEARQYIQRIVNGGKTDLELTLHGTPLEGLIDSTPDLVTLDELASQHFYSWFSGYDYVEGILEIGAIVLRVDKIPAEMTENLHEIRNCYAFQQYLAVCVLCRALIEITLRHICQLEGFFDPEHRNFSTTRGLFERKAKSEQRDYKIPEDYMMQPADLRYLLNTDNSFKKFKDPIADLYSQLSRVVHGNKTVSKKESKAFAKKTLKLIHDLYEV
ncbi:MAG: hypothetical protein LAT52_10990 [Balneolales bacterium]|nr:hypothetical protein [Balneolales bacterium]